MNLENKIKDDIQDLDLKNQFKFHGIINYDKALDIIQNYDFGMCFLHPNQNYQYYQ